MKKLLFIGDSITDANRDRTTDDTPHAYGRGYVFLLQSELTRKYFDEYRVYNRGIGGNNVTELYARSKLDCWNLHPDLITVTMGVNDVCFEEYTHNPNGVEIDRFERIYRMFIDDTRAKCGNVPMILIQPFILPMGENPLFSEFLEKVKAYAKVVEKIAADYGFETLSLQPIFEEYANKYGTEFVLYDGTHPAVFGAKLIAEEWWKAFEKIRAERRI